VLLSPTGPEVIDFGIAVASDATAHTRTGLLIGSPGWMSPEQVTGGSTGRDSAVEDESDRLRAVHSRLFQAASVSERRCQDDRYLPVQDRVTQTPCRVDPLFLLAMDGRRCGFMGGGTHILANLRANYSCEGGGTAFGSPDRSTTAWTIKFQTARGSDLTDLTIGHALGE
jgi:serine/threonine protein kinase